MSSACQLSGESRLVHRNFSMALRAFYLFHGSHTCSSFNTSLVKSYWYVGWILVTLSIQILQWENWEKQMVWSLINSLVGWLRKMYTGKRKMAACGAERYVLFLIFYLPLSFLELSVGDVFYFFCSSFIFLINMEKKKRVSPCMISVVLTVTARLWVPECLGMLKT